MITFTSIAPGSLRTTGGNRPVTSFPKTKPPEGDIVLLASPEELTTDNIISWPGEYDIADITVRGIGQMEGQQVSYVVELDGIRCAFLAAPLREWSEQDIERLGEVQVLALPAEDPKLSQKLLEEIDPRVLLLLPNSKGEIDVEVLKICGAQGKEPVTEYKLKGALPAEGREVVVFGK